MAQLARHKKKRRSEKTTQSKLNNITKLLVVNANILFTMIGLLLLCLALYFIFADWGNGDSGFFIGVGLNVFIIGMIFASMAYLGCVGLDRQTEKFGCWTGRKLLCFYQLMLTLFVVGPGVIILMIQPNLENIEYNYEVLQEIDLTSLVLGFVSLPEDLPFEGIEEAVASRFNSFFFGAASLCFDSGNQLYPWFWQWVNTYCPAAISQLSCQKCYDYTIVTCLADRERCETSHSVEDYENYACPYTICRAEVLDYLNGQMTQIIYGMAGCAGFFFVFFFLNMMLSCFTPKDNLDKILEKSGAINTLEHRLKLEKNAAYEKEYTARTSAKVKASRRRALNAGIGALILSEEKKREEELLLEEEGEGDVEQRVALLCNSQSTEESELPMVRYPTGKSSKSSGKSKPTSHTPFNPALAPDEDGEKRPIEKMTVAELEREVTALLDKKKPADKARLTRLLRHCEFLYEQQTVTVKPLIRRTHSHDTVSPDCLQSQAPLLTKKSAPVQRISAVDHKKQSSAYNPHHLPKGRSKDSQESEESKASSASSRLSLNMIDIGDIYSQSSRDELESIGAATREVRSQGSRHGQGQGTDGDQRRTRIGDNSPHTPLANHHKNFVFDAPPDPRAPKAVTTTLPVSSFSPEKKSPSDRSHHHHHLQPSHHHGEGRIHTSEIDETRMIANDKRFAMFANPSLLPDQRHKDHRDHNHKQSKQPNRTNIRPGGFL